MIEEWLSSEPVKTGLWAASWIGLVAMGVGPVIWALQQRFGGGLSQAMASYRRRSRRGRPCKHRQCFIYNLERDIAHAEGVMRRRTLYTAGYVSAVLAPAFALSFYALFKAYLAPGAAAPFLAAEGGEPVAASMLEIGHFFLVSGNFFVAVTGDDLAADIPALASMLSTVVQEPAITLNPEATVFASLVAVFKWVSGPALLFSAAVIADIWGGFRHMSDVLGGFREAREEVAGMPDDKSADEYRGLIERIVAGAMGRRV